MDGELELLGERIAEQAAHLDAAMHRLLTDLREFDQRGGWYKQGALSCAHWLSWRVGWGLVMARERVRVACKLAEFPTLDDALRRGEISYSKVRAMVRVATPANELLLLDHARLMTASQLETTCRMYALVQRHGEGPHPLGDLQRRHVRRRETEDGMVKIEAVLHPEEAELVWTMLNRAATQLGGELKPSAGGGSVEAQEPMGANASSAPARVRVASCEARGSAEAREPITARGALSNRASGHAARGEADDSAEAREPIAACSAVGASSGHTGTCQADDSAEAWEPMVTGIAGGPITPPSLRQPATGARIESSSPVSTAAERPHR